MSFDDPLGAATRVRRDVCQPDEQLLWAAYGRVFYYDVDGLDPLGAPGKNALAKGFGSIGRGAADVAGYAVADIVFGGFVDDSSDRPPPADVLAFGPGPDCLAHRHLRALEPIGGPSRLWALTSHRLAVTAQRPVAEPAAEPEEKSLLGKATRFGSGLVKFGKDVAKVVADNRAKFGDNIEGIPVTAAELTVQTEIPRAEIAGFALAQRRAKLRSAPCLRMSLVDGSGFDFLFGKGNQAAYDRMLALTNGR